MYKLTNLEIRLIFQLIRSASEHTPTKLNFIRDGITASVFRHAYASGMCNVMNVERLVHIRT
jgi:hypothetical protein